MEAKKFKTGMYGGKFMPFHKGHLYCATVAAQMCETLYVVLFHGGEQELKILEQRPNDQWLKPESRLERMKKACKDLKNVKVVDIDITDCKKADGTEDWDMETPLVLKTCGKLDAVFGSESGYEEYFQRAYPGAKVVIIDEERKIVPISGTMIRNMNEEERRVWMV
ncbi:MAG: adenylyltransferase/cytidyltransferase family protein [Clostridia bacterium]|nr:adenylyltransferase/cytidyltransferase family protein [Clostridia bacterium]